MTLEASPAAGAGLEARLAALTPAQRALFELALKKTGGVEAPAAAPPPVRAIPPRPAELAESCPLSIDQERLWFIQQLELASPIYNVYSAKRLRGDLDVGAFRAAVAEVVCRHEILRTSFPEVGGEPVQRIHPRLHLAVPLVDLTGLPDERREDEAQAAARQAVSRAFDLRAVPLLRPVLVRVDDDDHVQTTAIHHIITDRVTSYVLEGEVAALYSAFAQGLPSPLPPPPIQYGDFAVWQRNKLADEERLAPAVAWWKERLAEAPHVLELPTDRPRPAMASAHGGRRRFALSLGQSQALRSFAQRRETTMFVAGMAFWMAHLARLANQERLIVGTPMNYKEILELPGVLGYFLNQVAFYADLSANPTFEEILERVREASLGTYAHHELPFARLLDVVQPVRDLSRVPLTQVVFLLLDPPQGGWPELPGIAGRPYWVDAGRTQFDMVLALFWTDEAGLSGLWEYSADLYDPATIDRYKEQLRTLLAAALEDPGRRLWDVPLLPEGERHQVVFEWGEARPIPVAETLVGRFAEQVRRRPEAPALRDAHEELSYAELDRRSDLLAASLAAAVPPGSRVVLLTHRTAATVVGMLGILKAGCAYVPIDPNDPEERRRFLAEDARAAAVVGREPSPPRSPSPETGEGEASALKENQDSGANVHPEGVPEGSRGSERSGDPRWKTEMNPHPGGVPDPRAEPSTGLAPFQGAENLAVGHPGVSAALRPPATFFHRSAVVPLGKSDATGLPSPVSGEGPGVRAPVPPEAPAYVIYTSGSTGRPKGVVVTHANALRLFDACAPLFGFSDSDVWTVFHSFAFDFSVWEVWGALLHGGTAVVVPYEVSRQPEAFADLLARERVTVLSQTPSAFRALQPVAPALPDLRFVVFGGEALDPRALAPWAERHGLGRPHLVNMYGITETTVHVTFREITAVDVEHGTGSPIGVPLPDLAVRLLDPQGGPAPIGTVGEIAVGGGGVAQGYLGRPELTAARFVPDPWGTTPGARLYRSGDLARFLPTGELDVLGRIDHQVKVRGFRIELAEIEAALLAHPRVREAVVLARAEASGDKRLIAWVVARDGALAADALRAHLRERLPEPMIPAVFVPLAALPLTVNGKLDRRALPEPGPERPELATGYVAPRTPEEEALAAVWAAVLGLSRVGVHDNFFALGGDSILCLRAVGLAKERGLALSLPDFFKSPTIAELAAGGAGERGEEGAEPLTEPFGLVPDTDRGALPPGLEDAFPLTAMQQGMLYHQELTPEEPLYHDVGSYHLRGPFDERAFAEALRRVIARHPVLRTSFDLASFGEPLQLVHPPDAIGHAGLPLEVEDWRHLPEAAQEAAVEALVSNQRRNPFAVAEVPQIRFHLARRSESRFQMTVAGSHVIVDGWSVHSLLVELVSLYLALVRGEDPAPLPAPAVSMRDYVAAEVKAMASPAAPAFFRAALAGRPAAELPRWPVGERVLPRVRSRRVEVAPADFAGLNSAARRAGVPLKSLLLGIHARAVSHLSGRDGVTGLVVNGRLERPGGDEAVGLFLNTLPLTFTTRDGSWLDLARAAWAAEEALLPHRRYPVALLQREHGRTLFEVAFNFVHFHVARSLVESGEVEVLEVVKSEGVNFPLIVNASQGVAGDGLAFHLEYDGWELGDAEMAAAAEVYARALAAAAGEPEGWAGGSLASAAERHQLTVEWSVPVVAPGRLRPVLERFAEQVVRRPEAAALRAAGRTISYGDLDRRTGELAAALAARFPAGKAEPVVAVAVERAFSAVALLAVLKAGAVFLPLDPTHPRERLATLVGEARPSLVLAQAPELFVGMGVDVVACGEHPEGVPDLQAEPFAGLAPLQGAELDRDRPPGGSAALRPPATVFHPSGVAPHPDHPADLGHFHPTESPSPVAGEGPGERASVPLDHAAYVIYTSGSTGLPKGVAQTHRTLASLIAWQIGSSPACSGAVTLQFSAPTFDVSLQEILATWCAGGCLVVPAEEERRDPEQLLARLVADRVERLFLPFVALDQLAAASSSSWALPGSLREVITAGEALRITPSIRDLFFLSGAALRNQYGPTETHVATEHALPDDPEGWPELPPIGRPIFGLTAHLLSPDGLPVPLGAAGELFLGGGGVARGYWNRPDWTAERFVPDAVSRGASEPGARLYRTGDLARFLPSGELAFLGRADAQLKVRGYRVEPGEIEAALALLPGVREAAVALRQGRLVGYVVPREPEAAISSADLRQALAENLPEPLLPAAFVRLDRLPLTASGKLDRRALPEPEAADLPGGEAAYEPPRGPIEEKLAALWSEILDVPRIGRGDSFFALGGHSLSATRMISRARAALGCEVTLSDLFASPSLAALAERAAVLSLGSAGAAEIAAAAAPTAPLSAAQERLWFLEQLEPGTPAFNLPLAVRLSGRLEVPAFRRALASLAARQGALCTVFRAVDGEPVQIVAPADPDLPLPRIDLSALPVARRTAEGQELAEREALRPFDLTRGALFRSTLVDSGAGEYALLLTLHHLISDGWSFHVLVRELAAFYTAEVTGQPAALPDLPIQYADFATWQKERLAGSDLDRELAFWKETLAGAEPPADLPLARPRPARGVGRSGSFSRTLEKPLAERIRALAAEAGSTPFLVLLTALKALLARWTGQTDVTVGTVTAGRNRPELEGLVGCFVNVLALRGDLSGDPTFDELLDRESSQALAAFSHQDLPFERLLSALDLPRDLARTPLFSVALNGLDFGETLPETDVLLPGVRLAPLPAAQPTARFDLEIYATPEGEGTGLLFVYRADLFERFQIEALADQLRHLLAAAVAAPGTRLSELPLVSPESFPPATPVLPSAAFPTAALGRPVGERFATVAHLHAARRAVVAREGALTYGELWHEARRLASGLALRSGEGRGASPSPVSGEGDRGGEGSVALLYPHALGMPAAVLGTLLAGKTWVPLSPHDPDERLRAVLADGGAETLLVPAALAERARGVAAGRAAVLVAEEIAASPAAWQPPAVPAEALAYLLYTSGSAGEPKGVAQSHRGLLGHARSYGLRLGLKPADRITMLPSYAFDAGVMDLFGALLSGAELHLWDVKTDGLAGVAPWLAESGITVYHSTPTVFREALRHAPPLPALRAVVLGGEEAQARDLDLFRRVSPAGARLVNGLGPTESTLALQAWLGRDERVERVSLPVGYPVEETETRLVLDLGEQTAPYGLGEITVASPYLAIGYWGRPDATAAAFRPHPSRPGERRYHTGDLGRLLPDGTLEYAGRRDGQVKIRGTRVELGAIEAALRARPEVAEAAVAASRDEGGELRLAAWVEPAEGTEAEGLEERLSRHLAATLPAAFLPGALAVVPRLARTASDKIDRRSLPEVSFVSAAAGGRGPSTDTEKQLVALWGELLGVSSVGAEQRFFEMGGHSLLLMRLQARIEERFRVRLPLAEMFAAQSLEEMARAIETERAKAPAPAADKPMGGMRLVARSRDQRRMQREDLVR